MSTYRNPRKVTARNMCQMQPSQGNFSASVVTGWTSSPARHPLQTPRLDQLYSEAPRPDEWSRKRGRSSPDRDRLVFAAIGGAEKAAGITSIVATGKVEAFGSFGGAGNFEFFAQAPDKRAMHSHLPSGESIRTFDGRTGWFAIPLAVVPKYPLTGGELDGARLDALLTFPAQIAQSLTALRVGPRTEVGDKGVYLLQERREGRARDALLRSDPGCSCGHQHKQSKIGKCRAGGLRGLSRSRRDQFPQGGRSLPTAGHVSCEGRFNATSDATKFGGR